MLEFVALFVGFGVEILRQFAVRFGWDHVNRALFPDYFLNPPAILPHQMKEGHWDQIYGHMYGK